MTKVGLHIRIISPSKIEYDAQADMVLLPGEDGEFGILVKHMNMTARLNEGVVKIHTSGKMHNIDIKGGIVSMYEGHKIDILLG